MPNFNRAIRLGSQKYQKFLKGEGSGFKDPKDLMAAIAAANQQAKQNQPPPTFKFGDIEAGAGFWNSQEGQDYIKSLTTPEPPAPGFQVGGIQAGAGFWESQEGRDYIDGLIKENISSSTKEQDNELIRELQRMGPKPEKLPTMTATGKAVGLVRKTVYGRGGVAGTILSPVKAPPVPPLAGKVLSAPVSGPIMGSRGKITVVPEQISTSVGMSGAINKKVVLPKQLYDLEGRPIADEVSDEENRSLIRYAYINQPFLAWFNVTGYNIKSFLNKVVSGAGAPAKAIMELNPNTAGGAVVRLVYNAIGAGVSGAETLMTNLAVRLDVPDKLRTQAQSIYDSLDNLYLNVGANAVPGGAMWLRNFADNLMWRADVMDREIEIANQAFTIYRRGLASSWANAQSVFAGKEDSPTIWYGKPMPVQPRTAGVGFSEMKNDPRFIYDEESHNFYYADAWKYYTEQLNANRKLQQESASLANHHYALAQSSMDTDTRLNEFNLAIDSKAQEIEARYALGELSPLQSYTWAGDPDSYDGFLRDIAYLELQKNAPASEYEIRELKDRWANPWVDGVGQGIFDPLWLLPENAMKAIFGVGMEMVKVTGRGIGKIPVIGDLGRWGFRMLFEQAHTSTANKIGRTVYDSASRMRAGYQTANDFIRDSELIGDTALLLQRAQAEGKSAAEILALYESKRAAVPALQQMTLGDFQKFYKAFWNSKKEWLIDPTEWRNILAKGRDLAVDARKTQAVRSFLRKGMAKENAWAEAEKAAKEFIQDINKSDEYIEYLQKAAERAYLDPHRAFPGSVLIDDTMTGFFAKKMAESGMSEAARALNSASKAGMWIRGIWTNAVLNLTPSRIIRNFIDSAFRDITYGGNLLDDIDTLFTNTHMLFADDVGFIPIEFGQSLARAGLDFEEAVPARLLFAKDKPNLGILSYWRYEWDRLHDPIKTAEAIEKGIQAKGLKKIFGLTWNGLRDAGKAISATSAAFADFNTAIEFTLRLRMFHREYFNIIHSLEPGIMSKTLRDLSPEAQRIAKEAWEMSGGNAAKMASYIDSVTMRAELIDKVHPQWSYTLPDNFGLRMSEPEKFVQSVRRETDLWIEGIYKKYGRIPNAAEIDKFVTGTLDEAEKVVQAQLSAQANKKTMDTGTISTNGKLNAVPEQADLQGSHPGIKAEKPAIGNLRPKGRVRPADVVTNYDQAVNSAFGTKVTVQRGIGQGAKVVTLPDGNFAIQIGDDLLKNPKKMASALHNATIDAMANFDDEYIRLVGYSSTEWKEHLRQFLAEPLHLRNNAEEVFLTLARQMERHPEVYQILSKTGRVQDYAEAAINLRKYGYLKYISEAPDSTYLGLLNQEEQIARPRPPAYLFAGDTSRTATGHLAISTRGLGGDIAEKYYPIIQDYINGLESSHTKYQNFLRQIFPGPHSASIDPQYIGWAWDRYYEMDAAAYVFEAKVKDEITELIKAGKYDEAAKVMQNRLAGADEFYLNGVGIQDIVWSPDHKVIVSARIQDGEDLRKMSTLEIRGLQAHMYAKGSPNKIGLLTLNPAGTEMELDKQIVNHLAFLYHMENKEAYPIARSIIAQGELGERLGYPAAKWYEDMGFQFANGEISGIGKLADLANGMIRKADDGKIIFYGTGSHDLTTFIRESANLFYNHWERIAQVNPRIAKEMEAIKDALGIYSKNPSPMQMEEFSNAFIAYIAEGRVPEFQKAYPMRGLKFDIVEETVTKTRPDGSPIYAYFRRGTGGKKIGTIHIDPDAIKAQFAESPWLHPKMEGVTPLPGDKFQKPEDWLKFVTNHEKAHASFSRIVNGKNAETAAEYENRMNQIAMRATFRPPDEANLGKNLIKPFESFKTILSRTVFEPGAGNENAFGLLDEIRDSLDHMFLDIKLSTPPNTRDRLLKAISKQLGVDVPDEVTLATAMNTIAAKRAAYVNDPHDVVKFVGWAQSKGTSTQDALRAWRDVNIDALAKTPPVVAPEAKVFTAEEKIAFYKQQTMAGADALPWTKKKLPIKLEGEKTLTKSVSGTGDGTFAYYGKGKKMTLIYEPTGTEVAHGAEDELKMLAYRLENSGVKWDAIKDMKTIPAEDAMKVQDVMASHYKALREGIEPAAIPATPTLAPAQVQTKAVNTLKLNPEDRKQLVFSLNKFKDSNRLGELGITDKELDSLVKSIPESGAWEVPNDYVEQVRRGLNSHAETLRQQAEDMAKGLYGTPDQGKLAAKEAKRLDTLANKLKAYIPEEMPNAGLMTPKTKEGFEPRPFMDPKEFDNTVLGPMDPTKVEEQKAFISKKNQISGYVTIQQNTDGTYKVIDGAEKVQAAKDAKLTSLRAKMVDAGGNPIPFEGQTPKATLDLNAKTAEAEMNPLVKDYFFGPDATTRWGEAGAFATRTPEEARALTQTISADDPEFLPKALAYLRGKAYVSQAEKETAKALAKKTALENSLDQAWEAFREHYSFYGIDGERVLSDGTRLVPSDSPEAMQHYLQDMVRTTPPGEFRDEYIQRLWHLEQYQESILKWEVPKAFKTQQASRDAYEAAIATGQKWEGDIPDSVNIEELIPDILNPRVPDHMVSPAYQTWLRNNAQTMSEWEMMKTELERLRQHLKSGNGFHRILSNELKTELQAWKMQGVDAKSNLVSTALNGGQGIEGAIDKVNRVMLDYNYRTRFDNGMRNIFPFWQFPSRSWPFWAQTLVEKPQIIAAYNKYQNLSRQTRFTAGAITSKGKPLPSLDNYIPIPGTDLWFNPLAPLSFAYVLGMNVSTDDYIYRAQGGDDTPPAAALASDFMNMSSVYGFSMAPWTMFAFKGVTNMPDSTMTPWPIIPQISLVPRWMVDGLIDKANRTQFYGFNLKLGDAVYPQVTWHDYLVERMMLTKLNSELPNMEKSHALMAAKDIAKAIAEKGNNPLWVKAYQEYTNGEASHSWGSFLTGFFTKEFTDADADMVTLKNQNNLMKSALNNKLQASMFGLSTDAEENWDEYINYQNTPEGWLYRLYSDIGYVRNVDGSLETDPKKRADLLAKKVQQEENQALYYYKAGEMQKDFQKQMQALGVGAPWEQQSVIIDHYYQQLASIDYLYDYQGGYGTNKPVELIERDLNNRWYRMIIHTKPTWNAEAGETYDQYQLKIEEWRAHLPNIAKQLLPHFAQDPYVQNVIHNLRPDQPINGYLMELANMTTADNYDAWTYSRDSIFDALDNAWKTLYWQPYWQLHRDPTSPSGWKQGSAYEIADRQFLKEHPEPPTVEEIYAYMQPLYGDRFTLDDVKKWASFEDNGDSSLWDIQQRLETMHDDTWKSKQKVYEWLNFAGPGKGRSLIMSSLSNAQNQEIEEWLNSDGTMYDEQPEQLVKMETYLRNVVERLQSEKGLTAPTDDDLMVFARAEELNRELRQNMSRAIGISITDMDRVVNAYYSNQKYFSKDSPEDYKMIILPYLRMRNEWGKLNPDWAVVYEWQKSTKYYGNWQNYKSNIGRNTYIPTMQMLGQAQPLTPPSSLEAPAEPYAPSPFAIRDAEGLSGPLEYEFWQGVKWPKGLRDVASGFFMKEAQQVAVNPHRYILSPSSRAYALKLMQLHPEWKSFLSGLLE